MKKLKKMTVDGNTAAAMASQFFTEVAAIYPITPSSPMAEAIDKWSAMGKKIFLAATLKLWKCNRRAERLEPCMVRYREELWQQLIPHPRGCC